MGSVQIDISQRDLLAGGHGQCGVIGIRATLNGEIGCLQILAPGHADAAADVHAIPIRLELANAIGQSRVGGQPAGEGAVQPLREEKVTEGSAVGMEHQGGIGVTGDLFQRSGQSLGVAGKLHRRGVGQCLPLPIHGRLEQFAKEHTAVA